MQILIDYRPLRCQGILMSAASFQLKNTQTSELEFSCILHFGFTLSFSRFWSIEIENIFFKDFLLFLTIFVLHKMQNLISFRYFVFCFLVGRQKVSLFTRNNTWLPPSIFPMNFHKIGYAAEWVALGLDLKISSTGGLFAKRVSGSRGGQWCESGVALEGGNSAQLARHHNQPVTQAVTQLSHKLSHIFSH